VSTNCRQTELTWFPQIWCWRGQHMLDKRVASQEERVWISRVQPWQAAKVPARARPACVGIVLEPRAQLEDVRWGTNDAPVYAPREPSKHAWLCCDPDDQFEKHQTARPRMFPGDNHEVVGSPIQSSSFWGVQTYTQRHSVSARQPQYISSQSHRMISREATNEHWNPTTHCISLPHKEQREPIVDDTGLAFQRDSQSTFGSLATRARASHGIKHFWGK